MRAALVAIFLFAGLLVLGHYVAAPFFCRGDIGVPGLDARALCSHDFHLSRSGSVLLYFSAIAASVFFGAITAFLSGGKSAVPETKEQAKPVETFDEIVAAEEKKSAPAVASTVAVAAAKPAAAGTKTADAKSVEVKAAPAAKTEPGKEPPSKPAQSSDAPAVTFSEVIAAGLAAKKGGASKGFEGTNEELLERFRELKKQEGVNSIAQAQRLLDESTLSALARGVDPKQHLSQIAHLVLAEDPDLKSGVVRGVVVHVAARLKELGVVKQNLPGTAKGAA